MGRLFWKFFFAILFAQILATLGVGATFWLLGQAGDLSDLVADGVPVIDTRGSAAATLDGASVAYKYGSLNGLRDFMQTAGAAKLYVVDVAGNELQGRPVSAALLTEAERLSNVADDRPIVRSFGGHGSPVYTAFVSRAPRDLGPRAGPGAFPGPPPMFGAPGKEEPRTWRGASPDRPGHRIPYIMITVGTLASLLFAAVLAWYISRPIRALRAAFAAASSGDLAPKFAGGGIGTGDELVQLGMEFDRMSGQLRALMDNQQRLLHDVSHELRSPLARIQAAIGLAYQQPEKLASSLDRIERECMRMDRLVGELLTLSRLDSTMDLPPVEEIAIAELILEIANDARFEAAHQGRMVEVLSAGSGIVKGVPDLLWRGIENIVRNAIKYSHEGGRVEIDVQHSHDRVFIDVLDRGPGVADEHLSKIFQPFFRPDCAVNDVDGHGLGLAIAQRVIAAHHGAIRVHNRVGGGLCVTIVLPCYGGYR